VKVKRALELTQDVGHGPKRKRSTLATVRQRTKYYVPVGPDLYECTSRLTHTGHGLVA
jgi:hypothetical protein